MRMTLQEYKKRLVKVWILGVLGLSVIFGFVKWRGLAPSADLSWQRSALWVVVLPTFIVVRAYFRYKKWIQENPTEKK